MQKRGYSQTFLASYKFWSSRHFWIQQVEECDIEEYDFDDYNSVASTASLLNIHAELVQDENNASTTANQGSAFKTFQSRGRVEKQTVINGTKSLNSASLPHLTHEQLLRNARISKVQASISKVNNWGKYGSNGVLNTDQWKEGFLEAAQAGDLRNMVWLSFVWLISWKWA